ncbi:MAG: PIG-L family deacetylase [Verrucomicrobiae bacterium]|nr:PIG-L family deacetylase [Verrucomicrobiae bacterium]
MARHLKWAQVYRFYERVEPLLNHSIPKEELPRGPRVAVLAPHIDDETIGCGGVMMKHVAAGDRVAILTVADCTPERIAEGRAAGAILGAQRQEFLPFQSKSLEGNPDLGRRLADWLAEESPDLIYLPALLDRHSDHVTLNHLVAAWSARSGWKGMIYGYEVWSTLTPNVVVDISNQRERKSAALECFTSQNRSNNWAEASLALNRYRGVTTGAGDYAEAFHRMTSSRHRELIAQLWR